MQTQSMSFHPIRHWNTPLILATDIHPILDLFHPLNPSTRLDYLNMFASSYYGCVETLMWKSEIQIPCNASASPNPYLTSVVT